MKTWLIAFIASGRAERLAWVLLLLGVTVLAVYAYQEHDRRQVAESAGNAGLRLTERADRLEAQRDSLATKLAQCTGREAATLTANETAQATEAARVAAARARAATQSAAQQQGKLAARYPDHRPR